MIRKDQRLTFPALLLLAATLQACATSEAISPEPSAPSAMRVSMEDRLSTAVANTTSEDIDFRNRPVVQIYHRDGIVLLTGQVTSEEAKSSISNSVAFSAGAELRRLSNELRVVESIDLSLAETDANLASTANALLASTEPSLAEQTEAVVENAVVYLMGRVTRSQGEEASRLVSGLEGVAAVKIVFDYTD
jgi:osmotically-inducible protein OsmY